MPFWAHFLRIKALQAPFLPKLPPNLPIFPLTCPKKNWRNMTSKKNKRLHFDFGRHFCKIKAHKRFCQGCRTFCPNLHRFFPDFKGFFPDIHQTKSFLGRLPPPAPPPPTPLALNVHLKTFKQIVWMPKKPFCPILTWSVLLEMWGLKNPLTLDERYPSNLGSYSSLW